MTHLIYNALREIEGFTTIDLGDGFIYLVYLDWKNKPEIDLSQFNESDLISMFFTRILDKELFENSQQSTGYKEEPIMLSMIEKINGVPVKQRIKA